MEPDEGRPGLHVWDRVPRQRRAAHQVDHRRPHMDHDRAHRLHGHRDVELCFAGRHLCRGEAAQRGRLRVYGPGVHGARGARLPAGARADVRRVRVLQPERGRAVFGGLCGPAVELREGIRPVQAPVDSGHRAGHIGDRRAYQGDEEQPAGRDKQTLRRDRP